MKSIGQLQNHVRNEHPGNEQRKTAVNVEKQKTKENNKTNKDTKTNTEQLKSKEEEKPASSFNEQEQKTPALNVNLQLPPPSFNPLWRFKYECNNCHIKFTSEKDLNMHMERAHVATKLNDGFNATVSCYKCSRRFRNRSLLKLPCQKLS